MDRVVRSIIKTFYGKDKMKKSVTQLALEVEALMAWGVPQNNAIRHILKTSHHGGNEGMRLEVIDKLKQSAEQNSRSDRRFQFPHLKVSAPPKSVQLVLFTAPLREPPPGCPF